MKVKLDKRSNSSLNFNEITARVFAENITYLDWKGISKIQVNYRIDETLFFFCNEIQTGWVKVPLTPIEILCNLVQLQK